MNEFASNDGSRFNRAGFLAGSIAAIGTGLCKPVIAVASAPAGITSTVPPQQLLNRLMAGNKRFVNNQLPTPSSLTEKREELVETQAPFASILTCADSRVVPNFAFVQGLGDLFVERVAGNFPDDVVIGSIEYAVEHLGTRVIMVLGHQNCGAVKAVYSAIETNTPLPAHLFSIQQAMAPGIADVVKAKGSMDEAVSANVRAAVANLKKSPPIISKGATDGSLLVVGAVYHLANGEVKLVA